jgi:hypothetical protein
MNATAEAGRDIFVSGGLASPIGAPVKRSALASVEPVDDARSRHLRPVEQERRGAKFAALDHDVARVLGPQRGAAVLYGFLASTWYEFADPQKLADRKKKIVPGDWVEVNYRQFMEIGGTNAKASIIRWLRILSEDTHSCPWGRCGNEHPLVVVQRQGQSRPNRYRKWRCGEDTLVVRRRVHSQKLSEAAKRRVASGQRLNGILEPAAIVTDAAVPDAQLALLTSLNEVPDLEVLQQDFSPVSALDDLKSPYKTSESLATELQEVSQVNAQKSYHETSLREKSLNTDSVGLISRTAAEKDRAVAIEEADEVDAVACEVVEAVLTLAQRIEPGYADERAWFVARRLAAAVLETVHGGAAAARVMLVHAITDSRLSRATNPIGLLIRGVVGDGCGADRYLLTNQQGSTREERGLSSASTGQASDAVIGSPPGLHNALLEALREGRTFSDSWLRERGISPRALAIARAEVAAESDELTRTPLAEKLAADDPKSYTKRLEGILAELELPAFLRHERRLDHPMLRGMCVARLEAELQRAVSDGG